MNSNLKKLITLVCVMTVGSIFSSCQKSDSKSDFNEENKQNISVVQTEWNASDHANNQSGESPTPPSMEAIKPNLPESPKPIQDQNTAGTKALTPYSIQVGAFLNANNATRLISRLKQKGYQTVLIHKSESEVKKWNIVRVEGFADKQSAQETAKKLANEEKTETAIVHNNHIVMIEDNMSKAKSEKTGSFVQPYRPTADHSFAFQVGGLRTKRDAQKQQSLLSKMGYKPYIAEVRGKLRDETWFAVRIGKYNTIDEAAKAANDFSFKENIPAKAVSALN